ncbi:MAG: B12-binding domain-containing radical SAM protein [Deltaproteobacteria bacterium]|nr:MAG: B12-binding domain-containing radical SAM protein [Deltaproteobacteria bacterium]
MKILLIAAATPDTFWSFKHVLPFVSRRAAFPPLGLLTVASMLPKHWQLRLIDLNTTRLRDSDILWADYVFLSAMIVQADSARAIAVLCRSKQRTVIAGGPLFTTGHTRFPEIDHFVLGEAENIMPTLIADMESGRLERFYSSSQRPDITQTPAPRWDLIKLRRYATMPLQFSRGCPFNCEFCDIIVMNGRIPRTKSPRQMVKELESLVEAGWQESVFIVDDNFIGNKVKVKALLRAMISWRDSRGIKLSFTTEASLNLADDEELLDLMVQAGFKKVFVGIESPDEESLIECEKIQNARRDLVAAVKKIQHSGMEVMGGFIIGFDSDKKDIFERMTSFIERSGIVTAMVGLLTALPETRLFSRLKRENRIIHDATGNNVDGVLNFLPKLDREYLVHGYRMLVKRLYAPRTYYERILRFLQEYRPRGPRFRPAWRECLALIRSFWVMGICTRGQREYWRFVAKVMVFHRRVFPEAMTLAIMGHHFRKVAAAI